MFLHVGSDILVNKNEIIVILNIINIDNFKINIYKNNLKEIKVSKLTPKSCIITNTNIIYFSPISTTTLQKRLKKIY